MVYPPPIAGAVTDQSLPLLDPCDPNLSQTGYYNPNASQIRYYNPNASRDRSPTRRAPAQVYSHVALPVELPPRCTASPERSNTSTPQRGGGHPRLGLVLGLGLGLGLGFGLGLGLHSRGHAHGHGHGYDSLLIRFGFSQLLGSYI